MSKSATLSRRKFIQIAAVGAATAPLAGCLSAISPWRFLRADEARTLEAICDRIIPADQDPGAVWAGVVIFIDRQLMGSYKRFRKTYRSGLAGTNATSVELFSKPFAELNSQQQDTVLQSMEKGQARGEGWKQASSKAFFDLVVSHTMQGFYGDPRHGGNRERVSWKMVRLPYPPLRGRQQQVVVSG